MTLRDAGNSQFAPPIVEFGDVDDSDLFGVFLFKKEGEIAINASDLPLYVRPTIVYVLHGKKRPIHLGI